MFRRQNLRYAFFIECINHKHHCPLFTDYNEKLTGRFRYLITFKQIYHSNKSKFIKDERGYLINENSNDITLQSELVKFD